MTETDSLAKVAKKLYSMEIGFEAGGNVGLAAEMKDARERIERLDAEMRKDNDKVIGDLIYAVQESEECIQGLRARLAACDPEWRSLYAIAGGAVCEARNVWSSEHEENWLETDENHPDDFVGRAVVDAIAAELQRRNIAAQSSAKGVDVA